jgi:hypothetical protein
VLHAGGVGAHLVEVLLSSSLGLPSLYIKVQLNLTRARLETSMLFSKAARASSWTWSCSYRSSTIVATADVAGGGEEDLHTSKR